MALAVTGQPSLPALSPYQILELAERRINEPKFKVRDAAYEAYAKYYRGKHNDPGPSVLASNAQGRPLLRLGESMNRERAYSSQRLAPIIDDSQALLGRMPASRVEPPDPEPSGIDKAEKLTRFIVSTHELSQMDRQQALMGYFLPGLGDGCYALEVDPDERRVVWTVVEPDTAYPSFRRGHRRFEILDLIIRYSIDPYAAAAEWGYMRSDDSGRVPVTIYTSPFQRTIVVGDEAPEQVAHVEWNLRFCPAVWVFNKINGHFAQSDIAQSMVQQDALDFLWAVSLDGAVYNTYPMVGVKNAANVSENIAVGPGALIQLQQDGDIIVRDTQGDLSSINQMKQGIENEIYSSTGSSEARQTGQLHSSIQTGRAIHAAQGPQATRIELKQVELGAAIQRANSMTLEMQEKAPYIGDHEFEMFGRYKGMSFRDTFLPKRDIDGWYRTAVFWEPVTGMNLQQKVAIAYEGQAAGIWDDEHSRELVGIEDPVAMGKRVERMKERQARMEMEMQQQAQPGGGAGTSPPGGAQPPPGGAAPPPSAGGGGGQPPEAPRPSVARPYGLGQQQGPLPSGVPKGITLDAVKRALELVGDRLKGTVALVGDLAKQGVGQHIQALISDSRDYNRVLPLLRGLDPKAEVKQQAEAKWPDSAVRVV